MKQLRGPVGTGYGRPMHCRTAINNNRNNLRLNNGTYAGDNTTPAVLQGSVRVRLQGAGGRHQDMTLDQPRIQLRYYQQFSGEWAVPAGFTPERVDIQIKGGSSTVERRFKWEVKNR